MSALTTFEDRLRLAVDQCKYKSVRTCSVDQQDLADALSLLAALRTANTDAADRHVAIAADLDAAQLEVARLTDERIVLKQRENKLYEAEAEVLRLTGPVEKAFDAGWQARGDACYPTPMEFEHSLAWQQFAFQQREGLDPKGDSNG